MRLRKRRRDAVERGSQRHGDQGSLTTESIAVATRFAGQQITQSWSSY